MNSAAWFGVLCGLVAGVCFLVSYAVTVRVMRRRYRRRLDPYAGRMLTPAEVESRRAAMRAVFGPQETDTEQKKGPAETGPESE